MFVYFRIVRMVLVLFCEFLIVSVSLIASAVARHMYDVVSVVRRIALATELVFLSCIEYESFGGVQRGAHWGNRLILSHSAPHFFCREYLFQPQASFFTRVVSSSSLCVSYSCFLHFYFLYFLRFPAAMHHPPIRGSPILKYFEHVPSYLPYYVEEYGEGGRVWRKGGPMSPTTVSQARQTFPQDYKLCDIVTRKKSLKQKRIKR